uniref:hypothetical protein n=1 Tax=Amycolatopsis sp. CA-096443 TaxID=3239919 RepID=UPI003F4991B1
MLYMTVVEYTCGHYVTQEQLRRAYQRLGRPERPAPAWSAVLLIGLELRMQWACPVLETPKARSHSWNVIAEAGELDYPPLRPEPEIWPALLERHPQPTGDTAEKQARFLGMTVEQWHRDALRRRFLTPADAQVRGVKLNPGDINFDPLVRDWDATARQLAAFLDEHRPPRLTAEQRVMAQGVRLAQIENQRADARTSLARLMRNAEREQPDPRPRKGFKTDLARWGGVSRPTVNAWLAGADPDDPGMPDDAAARPAPDRHGDPAGRDADARDQFDCPARDQTQEPTR